VLACARQFEGSSVLVGCAVCVHVQVQGSLQVPRVLVGLLMFWLHGAVVVAAVVGQLKHAMWARLR
jgi:hypothetical protein